MAKTVFSVLLDQLEEDKTRFTSHLASGGATDFPAYREIVGVLRGLTAAQQLISDLAKNMERNDD